jgi:hypothetical protein
LAHLYQLIQSKVNQWREDSYPCNDYPAISEILEYATILLEDGATQLRFLRAAQLRALETYWYLRLVEATPHVFDLYKKYYSRPLDLLAALGMDTDSVKDFALNEGMETLWQQVRQGEQFVKKHKLESIHETLTLEYPSYILALAMGAGKTMLIGAIIATEFALALEYHPDREGPFIQNALVFAPGLTILESLRELAEVDYSQIIPPRLFKAFDATYKITFTQDGQKDLPVIRGSRYNLIVTNTEKIRIQKVTRRHQAWTEMEYQLRMIQDREEANLRLLAIASLPNLGVFSDEAHHTYGRDVGKQLKRVRQTVDYLHEKTNVIAVINTTGTPYYERQPLKDVVIWYGLSQGIQDNVLKSVDNSIYAYDFNDASQFVSEVVHDFFETYGDVRLPNGAWAKMAVYFPQNSDLHELRPTVEQTLLQMGHSTDIVLRNTNQSTEAEIDAFNRLNEPKSQHRVILLVNKGTEGWNCPSLFACVLARRLTSSNNFVLQASTRCLRQVPGNIHKARIYLSMDNRGILDRQLQETYGETIDDLRRSSQDICTEQLVLRKLEMPPLVVNKRVKRVIPWAGPSTDWLLLDKPDIPAEVVMVKHVYSPAEAAGQSVIMAQISEDEITYETEGIDLYTVATRLAAVYRVDLWSIYRELKRLYGPGGIVPDSHLPELQAQIERQRQQYTIEEEEVEVALALVRPEGFKPEIDEGGNVVYTAEITYQKSKENLLLRWRDMPALKEGGFGFHYDPYNFDSEPEKQFFTEMLRHINLRPEQVEDIYFTGALTDANKTDFYVEYQDVKGKTRRYTPDFVIRRKDGRCYIVEVKASRVKDDAVDGENGLKAMAIRKWVGLNPDKLRYEMIFTPSDGVAFNQLEPARRFIIESGN